MRQTRRGSPSSALPVSAGCSSPSPPPLAGRSSRGEVVDVPWRAVVRPSCRRSRSSSSRSSRRSSWSRSSSSPIRGCWRDRRPSRCRRRARARAARSARAAARRACAAGLRAARRLRRRRPRPPVFRAPGSATSQRRGDERHLGGVRAVVARRAPAAPPRARPASRRRRRSDRRGCLASARRDDRGDAVRGLRAARLHVGHRRAQVLLGDLDERRAAVGRAAGEAVVEQRPERVDVGAAVERMALRLLGRDVVARPEHPPGVRQRRVRRRRARCRSRSAWRGRRRSAARCAA